MITGNLYTEHYNISS